MAQSAILLEQARAGELDFVVCFQSRSAPRTVRREPMVWLGHREVALRDPLPIAVLDPPCGYIEAATQALRVARRAYSVVLRTPSLAGLRAALEAGLAVACRTALLRSGSIEVLGAAERLPPLPDIAFSMYVPRPMSPAARRLATLVRDVVSQSAPQPVVAASMVAAS